MYNFLVTAAGGAWDGEPYEFDSSRIFEYTSDNLKEKFRTLQPNLCKELASYPALFCYEDCVGQDAHIGWITRIQTRGRVARVEYAIEAALPPISNQLLKDLDWDLEISEWELNRTHWAVKDVQLFAALKKAKIISDVQVHGLTTNGRSPLERDSPSIPIQPTVFRIPTTSQEMDLVSVMMPFQDQFSEVYDAIRETSADLEFRCENANEVWNETEIIQDIFALIYRSTIVICDFTDRNPNVFYEAGIAHTLGREVIPIVQNEGDIPFDLSHHRYVKYLNNAQGRDELKAKLRTRLSTIRQRMGR